MNPLDIAYWTLATTFVCDCANHSVQSQRSSPISQSDLYGLLFAVAGLALFLAQVATAELWTAYRTLRELVTAACGHDTLIFPDYEPTHLSD